MKVISSLLILLCGTTGVFADVVTPFEFNDGRPMIIAGVKAGYKKHQGILIAPEITFGYLHGTSYKTDPFAGITFGYQKVISKSRNESDIYSDICVAVVREPVIILGISYGVQLAFRYGSRPLLSMGDSKKHLENKFSIFGGWFTTTDVTISGMENKWSVAAAQKLALPLPMPFIDYSSKLQTGSGYEF